MIGSATSKNWKRNLHFETLIIFSYPAIKILKQIIIEMNLKIIILLSAVSFNFLVPQERFITKDSYNGYAWNNMFVNSKYNFLSSLLDRWRLPEKPATIVSDSNCTKILYEISEGRIRINVSLKDIVGYLNIFYDDEKNLDIPIVSSYCTIVKNIDDSGIPFIEQTTDSLRIIFRKEKERDK